VADALARATGQHYDVPDVVAAPQQWSYRSAVQPAVSAGALGYREPGSNEVAALESDPTANEGVNAAWRALLEIGPASRHASIREVAIRGTTEGEALVALIASGKESAALDLGHRLVESGVAGVAWAPYDPRG